MSSSHAAAPAGWYADVHDASRLRYWDGTAWTNHYSPRYPSAPGPVSAPMAQGPIPTSRPSNAHVPIQIGTAPNSAGWYLDPDTGRPRYWDGKRWKGQALPAPKNYTSHVSIGLGTVAVGLYVVFISQIGGGSIDGYLLFGLALCAAGVYMAVGKGALPRAYADMQKQRQARDAERETALMSSLGPSRSSAAPPTVNDSTRVAQVSAIGNPETARALQNLQNLLYTRVLTEEEFRVAKNNLFRTDTASTDAVAHIEQLASLHRAGILGDYEFTAAKLKVLGV